MFTEVRAEIIAEFFAKEQNAALLFPAARELERRAHARSRESLINLSVEAKSIIGVFADFVGTKRTALLSNEFAVPISTSQPVKNKIVTNNLLESGDKSDNEKSGKAGDNRSTQEKHNQDPNPKLL